MPVLRVHVRVRVCVGGGVRVSEPVSSADRVELPRDAVAESSNVPFDRVADSVKSGTSLSVGVEESVVVCTAVGVGVLGGVRAFVRLGVLEPL